MCHLQAIFDTYIATLSRFATDTSDPQAARLAFAAMNRMSAIWGGPDIPFTSSAAPAPTLPRFDAFILTRFAPLPWNLLSAPGFNASDGQVRSVVQEAAALQWTIVRKLGQQYQRQLETELRGLGVS